MIYTKEQIKALDQPTLDIVINWLYDWERRSNLFIPHYKTRKAAEIAQERQETQRNALNIIKTLKNYASGAVDVADKINLFDEK